MKIDATREAVMPFINEAFRNVDLPPLDGADIEDIAIALGNFLRNQHPATPAIPTGDGG